MKKLGLSNKFAKAIINAVNEELTALDKQKSKLLSPYFIGDDSVFQKVDDNITLPVHTIKEILQEATGGTVIIDDMQLLLTVKEAGFKVGVQYCFSNGIFVATLVVYGCKSNFSRSCMILQHKDDAAK